MQYAFLRDWAELRKQCAAQNATWPLPESRKAVADQFGEVCKKIPGNEGTHGLVLSEGGLRADKFLEQFHRIRINSVANAWHDY